MGRLSLPWDSPNTTTRPGHHKASSQPVYGAIAPLHALKAEQGPHSPLQPTEKAPQQNLPPLYRPLRAETEAGHDSSHSHRTECPRGAAVPLSPLATSYRVAALPTCGRQPWTLSHRCMTQQLPADTALSASLSIPTHGEAESSSQTVRRGSPAAPITLRCL